MTQITRYVLSELLKVFIVALAGMTLLMILVGLAQEALRQGLGFEPIMRLIPYVLPNALRFAVPGTMLFAACLVFGRMSASNEVVAIKSMGVSPMTLIAPALVLAIVTSCIAVWLNDVAVSWGRRGMHRVVLQSVEDIVYGMLRTHRSYSNKNIAINVKKVDGKRLERVTLTRHSKDHSRPMVVTADAAELTSNFENNTLKITLYNANVEFGDKAALEFPDKMVVEIPLTDAAKRGGGGRGPSDFAWSEIPNEILAQKRRIEETEQQMAAEAAYQMATGDFRALADDSWKKRQSTLDGTRERLFRPVHRTLAAVGQRLQLFLLCDGGCSPSCSLPQRGCLEHVRQEFPAHLRHLLSPAGLWCGSSQVGRNATLHRLARERDFAARWAVANSQSAAILEWQVGRWQVAVAEVAGGRWQVAGGRWQVAGGRWQVAGGRWQVAGGRWQVAGGRWQVAGGRWLAPSAGKPWLTPKRLIGLSPCANKLQLKLLLHSYAPNRQSGIQDLLEFELKTRKLSPDQETKNDQASGFSQCLAAICIQSDWRTVNYCSVSSIKTNGVVSLLPMTVSSRPIPGPHLAIVVQKNIILAVFANAPNHELDLQVFVQHVLPFAMTVIGNFATRSSFRRIRDECEIWPTSISGGVIFTIHVVSERISETTTDLLLQVNQPIAGSVIQFLDGRWYPFICQRR